MYIFVYEYIFVNEYIFVKMYIFVYENGLFDLLQKSENLHGNHIFFFRELQTLKINVKVLKNY